MPRKGASVTLKPGPLPENSISCRWYRGSAADPNLIIIGYPKVPGDTKGPAYTGRETVDSNCSLQITDLNTTDSGIYTMTTDAPGMVVIGSGKFEVIDSSGSGSGGLSRGAIAGIILGSLAVMLALTGTLFFFFFFRRGRHQGGKTDSPVIPPPSFYENIPSSGQVKTGANLESSPGTSHTYEELQCRDQAVYQEVK